MTLRLLYLILCSVAGRGCRGGHGGWRPRRKDEGGVDGRGLLPAVVGDVDGARLLEESLPRRHDLGQAAAVGGVAKGHGSGDDLDAAAQISEVAGCFGDG
jgi:hypothetical protein